MENNNTLGLIFSENPEVNLGELTAKRSIAAVPVGGRYRIIDFMLSNMVNSGIINVGIATSARPRSLTDHLGSGKAWDMARKENGLFILPPPEGESVTSRRIAGIDYINGAMSYLRRSRQEYVLLCDCNTVCNISFSSMIEKHTEKDANITVLYTEAGKLDDREAEKHILFEIDEDERISDVQVYPKRQKADFSYMHMMLIRKDLLLDLVDDCLAHDKHSISKDILLANVKKLRIYGCKYDGYRKKIDSIASFFEFNLELLRPEVRAALFGAGDDRSIYTKVKDSVPTRYGRDAEVVSSFVADGCSIEGKVENSIIFRGVKIGKGSSVKNAVIMQDSHIMDACRVENAIFDKNVILSSGKQLIGQGTYPLVIGKGTRV